jgi:D-alanine-D-alanine ligase
VGFSETDFDMKESPPGSSAVTVPADHSAGERLDITLLAGGPGDEREVSLASGKCVAAALLEFGHRVTVCDVSPADLSALDRPTDLFFIALHGEFGEDGALQAALERRGLLFTGTGAAASAVAMDKAKSKARFIEAGVATPRFDVARPARLMQVADRWRLPVVVKPVRSGSSVDTYLIRDRRDFGPKLRAVVHKHGESLVEELIDGPELTVGILGDKALPVIEIRTKRAFYDYQAKYVDEDTQYLFDIDLPPTLLADVQAQSLRAAVALDCRDFCRVDWKVDQVTHEPYVLEINTIPGFTSHSLLPKAAARAGESFGQLCQRIVEMAMSRANARV